MSTEDKDPMPNDIFPNGSDFQPLFNERKHVHAHDGDLVVTCEWCSNTIALKRADACAWVGVCEYCGKTIRR